LIPDCSAVLARSVFVTLPKKTLSCNVHPGVVVRTLSKSGRTDAL
jgi:hypothetical protein